MKKYFGHDTIVKALSKDLPAASLFVGPTSVGKWELAEKLREKYKVHPSDVLRIKRLTQDNAKFVAKFATLTAQKSPFRLCIIRLEKETTVALNTLLKTLEDPSETRFILISDKRTLPTIESRCAVYEFGLLQEDDVANVLTHVKGLKPEVAEKRASLASGRVLPALVYSNTQEAKTLVIRALEAVHDRDTRALDVIATRWTEEHTNLLIDWCYERLTGKWKMFADNETSLQGASYALRILSGLKENLRPRLVVRLTLTNLI